VPAAIELAGHTFTQNTPDLGIAAFGMQTVCMQSSLQKVSNSTTCISCGPDHRFLKGLTSDVSEALCSLRL